MIRRFEHEGVTWVDLESPTAEEVAGIAEEFAIGPSLARELLTPTPKPRVDVYPKSIYAVFHFPSFRHTRERDLTEEIDVVVGTTYLLTAHYRPSDAIDDFARALEVEQLLKRSTAPVGSGYLLFELATRLYRESESELDLVEDTVGRIEADIFMGREREMVAAISRASRELLTHRRILGNHTETLEALEAAAANLFGDEMKNYFHAVAALHWRAHARAVSMADTVTELRETNMALLSTKQNDVMKSLTIIASVMLPLSLIASLFGMNTENAPFAGSPNDFWIVVAIMAVCAVGFVAYFKIKKWF